MTTADTDEMNDEAEPITRDARFIKTAIAILSETGRTDFTASRLPSPPPQPPARGRARRP